MTYQVALKVQGYHDVSLVQPRIAGFDANYRKVSLQPSGIFLQFMVFLHDNYNQVMFLMPCRRTAPGWNLQCSGEVANLGCSGFYLFLTDHMPLISIHMIMQVMCCNYQGPFEFSSAPPEVMRTHTLHGCLQFGRYSPSAHSV